MAGLVLSVDWGGGDWGVWSNNGRRSSAVTGSKQDGAVSSATWDSIPWLAACVTDGVAGDGGCPTAELCYAAQAVHVVPTNTATVLAAGGWNEGCDQVVYGVAWGGKASYKMKTMLS